VSDDGRVHMQVPWNQAERRSGFVIATRSSRISNAAICRGVIRVAPLPRAVADAARAARSERTATAIVIEAFQRNLVRPAELEHELGAGARRGSGILRRAIATARIGAWSVAEVDLLDLLGTSLALPHAWPNPELRAPDGTVLPTPDAWFDDVGLAVQVHSAQYHSAPADWDRTRAHRQRVRRVRDQPPRGHPARDSNQRTAGARPYRTGTRGARRPAASSRHNDPPRAGPNLGPHRHGEPIARLIAGLSRMSRGSVRRCRAGCIAGCIQRAPGRRFAATTGATT